jgi:hypothetical protein
MWDAGRRSAEYAVYSILGDHRVCYGLGPMKTEIKLDDQFNLDDLRVESLESRLEFVAASCDCGCVFQVHQNANGDQVLGGACAGL